jgi:hypothetical protein
MRLGNVAHQHVDIYTKDNNKSLTMSIITLERFLSTKDAYTTWMISPVTAFTLKPKARVNVNQFNVPKW